VAKVGTFKAGGTISQQAAVHPWLAADAHINKQNDDISSPLWSKYRQWSVVDKAAVPLLRGAPSVSEAPQIYTILKFVVGSLDRISS
jgi:hypothetical protein